VDLEGSTLSWYWDIDALKRELLLDGKLVLITNVKDLSASELVQRYKGLADIERGFRVLKSEIEIAPVHHRLPHRIRAHALICFLALVIQRVMRWRLRSRGLPISPERLLERLQAIQYHRVRLATGKVLTGVTAISTEQRSLFEAIEVAPPTRRRLEDRV
jgi:transposase